MLKDTPIKILTVFGTRPEGIKLVPVLKELARRSKEGTVRHAVCVTAQHRQMLDQVLDIFGIKPDYDLDLMTETQSPARVAAAVLARLEPVLEIERPDWVIVQGDTTTTAAASLAAHYLRIKVAHVEAGLRTYDKWQPFPEEVNRKVTSVVADLHFAPTEWAKRNLLREGVSKDTIVITGNTAIDSLQYVVPMPRPDKINDLIGNASGSGGDRLILVTTHRRENFGRPLGNICAAICELASNYPDVRIVMPVHMNPTVQRTVGATLSGFGNIRLIEPLDYVSLVHLMNVSHIVLTDSGGIQEEAPTLGKPVLVMRDVTERPEGVEAGVAKLVGADTRRIVNEVRILLEDRDEYEKMNRAVNPYGDGRASSRIVRALLGEPIDEFNAIPVK